MTHVRVLIEIKVPKFDKRFISEEVTAVSKLGFVVDSTYEPVPIGYEEEQHAIIRGMIEEDKIASLERLPKVAKVWRDAKIAPFRAPQ